MEAGDIITLIITFSITGIVLYNINRKDKKTFYYVSEKEDGKFYLSRKGWVGSFGQDTLEQAQELCDEYNNPKPELKIIKEYK